MSSARVLALTSDADLSEGLARLTAAAGLSRPTVAGDPQSARQHWLGASMVLVGADAAPLCPSAGLPRRNGVLLVGRDEPSPDMWRSAVGCGAEDVLVLPDAEAELLGRLADLVEAADRPGLVIGVVSGSGGAGGSTLSAALAVSAARQGQRVVLADLDPFGCGMDMMFGVEGFPGMRWKDLDQVSGRLSVEGLYRALPSSHGVALLSDGYESVDLPTATAVEAVLSAVRRAGDVSVVDLPRYRAPASMAAMGLVDTMLMAVQPRASDVVAAIRVAASIRDHTDDLRVVVRRGRSGELSTEEVTRALGLPVADEARTDPSAVTALELGEPPGLRARRPLALMGRRLIGQLTASPTERAA